MSYDVALRALQNNIDNLDPKRDLPSVNLNIALRELGNAIQSDLAELRNRLSAVESIVIGLQ